MTCQVNVYTYGLIDVLSIGHPPVKPGKRWRNMKATQKDRKKLGKFLEIKMAFHINSNDLENFLSDLFGHDIQMTESQNDVIYEVVVAKKPTIEEVGEIEQELINGSFECWRLSQVFDWLSYYDYIGTGTYLIHVG